MTIIGGQGDPIKQRWYVQCDACGKEYLLPWEPQFDDELKKQFHICDDCKEKMTHDPLR